MTTLLHYHTFLSARLEKVAQIAVAVHGKWAVLNLDLVFALLELLLNSFLVSLQVDIAEGVSLRTVLNSETILEDGIVEVLVFIKLCAVEVLAICQVLRVGKRVHRHHTRCGTEQNTNVLSTDLVLHVYRVFQVGGGIDRLWRHSCIGSPIVCDSLQPDRSVVEVLIGDSHHFSACQVEGLVDGEQDVCTGAKERSHKVLKR